MSRRDLLSESGKVMSVQVDGEYCRVFEAGEFIAGYWLDDGELQAIEKAGSYDEVKQVLEKALRSKIYD